jgi:hypothetical protein
MGHWVDRPIEYDLRSGTKVVASLAGKYFERFGFARPRRKKCSACIEAKDDSPGRGFEHNGVLENGGERRANETNPL